MVQAAWTDLRVPGASKERRSTGEAGNDGADGSDGKMEQQDPRSIRK
jgi:hypothetical protein